MFFYDTPVAKINKLNKTSINFSDNVNNISLEQNLDIQQHAE